MKEKKWFFPVLLLLFAGCGHPSGHRERTVKDSVAVSQTYDSIIYARERAEEDSVYRKSEAYRYAQETYHRRMAEQTAGMSHVDQLLYAYEVAVHAVNRAGRYAASYPEEMKDRRMQNLMRFRGEEALRLHDQLTVMKLSAEQRKRFEALNQMSN